MEAPRLRSWLMGILAGTTRSSPPFHGVAAVPRRSAAIVAGALFAAVMTFTAKATPAEGDLWVPNQPLVEGKRVFEEKGCQRCHGLPGSAGDERIGPDLGRQRSWQDFMQLAASLWNHTPAMLEKMREPQMERPTLSPDEMGKLAAYLFYLNFLDEAGDVARGRDLFERRSCSRCHQLAGRGGTVGPRLDELKGYASSLFLAQALWNHGPEMAAKMTELQLDRPRLESHDVADIGAFIRGAAQTAAPLEAGSPRAGKTLFQEKGCIKCHAIAGRGGTIGPDLGRRGTTQQVSQKVGALWNHGPPMWAKMKELGIPFPRFTDRDMSDLLAYLYFVEYMGESGNAAKGGKLFDEKSCAHCHGAGGGRKVGPDLATSDAIRSPVQWASAMWNHAPAMADKLREMQLAWPRFEDDEMRDLVEFLRSRSENK